MYSLNLITIYKNVPNSSLNRFAQINIIVAVVFWASSNFLQGWSPQCVICLMKASRYKRMWIYLSAAYITALLFRRSSSALHFLFVKSSGNQALFTNGYFKAFYGEFTLCQLLGRVMIADWTENGSIWPTLELFSEFALSTSRCYCPHLCDYSEQLTSCTAYKVERGKCRVRISGSEWGSMSQLLSECRSAPAVSSPDCAKTLSRLPPNWRG